MEDKLFEMAATQGIWALLSIALIFYVLKAQEKRDLRQEERENSYRKIIEGLSNTLNVVEDIKSDVSEIKLSLKK